MAGDSDKLESPDDLHLLDLGPIAIEMIGAVQVLDFGSHYFHASMWSCQYLTLQIPWPMGL